jgi:glycosyltransferase involved in cell wall biosynthesis
MISIIIPSFNKAAFISETIESVQSQSYSNWELIIVDDGSTDNSISIIEEFCSNDRRIKLYRRETLPKGGSACRNIGLKNAKGKYVVFLDADDVLLNFCLETRLYEIEKYSDNNFWVFPIGTFYKVIGDSTSVWIPKGDNFLLGFLKHDLPWHTMSVVWNKEFIDGLNGFDTDYPRLQDVELHTRALLKKNVSLKTFPNNIVDAYYRIDTNRTVQNLEQQLNKQKEGVFLYLKKHTSLLQTNNQRRAIYGTFFSFVTTLNYTCLVVNNEIDLHRKISKEIFKYIDNSENHLFWRSIYIRFYIKLYKNGFWKMRGFNFFMKYLFCS